MNFIKNTAEWAWNGTKQFTKNRLHDLKEGLINQPIRYITDKTRSGIANVLKGTLKLGLNTARVIPLPVG